MAPTVPWAICRKCLMTIARRRLKALRFAREWDATVHSRTFAVRSTGQPPPPNVKCLLERALMRIVWIVALVGSVFAQQPVDQAFIGRWAADHDGLPVIRLDLRLTAGALGGSMQIADIHLDTRGDVETVLSGLSVAAPLIDVTIRNRNTVTFARRDGDDNDRFEMSVSDDGAAEVRFVPSDADLRELADNGIPVPRPIRLVRLMP